MRENILVGRYATRNNNYVIQLITYLLKNVSSSWHRFNSGCRYQQQLSNICTFCVLFRKKRSQWSVLRNSKRKTMFDRVHTVHNIHFTTCQTIKTSSHWLPLLSDGCSVKISECITTTL